MKAIKMILLAALLTFVSISCYRMPLSEIRNSVVVEKGDRYKSIKVIEKSFNDKSGQYVWYFQTYYLCEYEYNLVQVGDSLNYSKNVIVNAR